MMKISNMTTSLKRFYYFLYYISVGFWFLEKKSLVILFYLVRFTYS